MIVTYNDNGGIDIDNSELRGIDSKEELGGLMEKGGEEEKTLKTDLKRTGWHEARKATDVKHVCPVCGTRYWGRPNKTYCGTPCKEVAKKRRSRKKKRDIRDFKPYRGKAGEVYFMYINDKGISKITFIPAFNAETREQAIKYIDKTCFCSEEVKGSYIRQVNEVIRK
jgi:predicted nucleic acid-binding Zn ribbon protein